MLYLLYNLSKRRLKQEGKEEEDANMKRRGGMGQEADRRDVNTDTVLSILLREEERKESENQMANIENDPQEFYQPPNNVRKKESLNVSHQPKRSIMDCPSQSKSRLALKSLADDESDESENSLPKGLLTLADRNNSQFQEFMS